MTTRGQKGGKVFYGWWVVLASGVGLAMCYGPVIVPTFGVFLKPLSQEFGWSRTQISLAFTLASLGFTLAAPFLGWLVDRFGARRVILPAVLLFGLSVLSLAVSGPEGGERPILSTLNSTSGYEIFYPA